MTPSKAECVFMWGGASFPGSTSFSSPVLQINEKLGVRLKKSFPAWAPVQYTYHTNAQARYTVLLLAQCNNFHLSVPEHASKFLFFISSWPCMVTSCITKFSNSSTPPLSLRVLLLIVHNYATTVPTQLHCLQVDLYSYDMLVCVCIHAYWCISSKYVYIY